MRSCGHRMLAGSGGLCRSATAGCWHLRSPSFAAAPRVMAADLAKTPATGEYVQACGDCHLMNFGGFATPERNIIFDMNDFDETLPAPWEWDIKRLATSFVLAARSNGLSEATARDLAVTCGQELPRASGVVLRDGPMTGLVRTHDDGRLPGRNCPKPSARTCASSIERAMKHTPDTEFPKTRRHGRRPAGHSRYAAADLPPSRKPASPNFSNSWRSSSPHTGKSLADDRRRLLDEYKVVDAAIKVVGIGSVGRQVLGRAADVGVERSTVPANQGSRAVGDGAVRRKEQISRIMASASSSVRN